MHMISDVELRVVVPVGQAGIQRRLYDAHEIARNERQPGLDKAKVVIERDVAFQNADAGNVQRHAGALQVEKNAVPPGQSLTAGMVPHGSPPRSVR